MGRGGQNENKNNSVRCMSDVHIPIFPSVTTFSAYILTDGAAAQVIELLDSLPPLPPGR